MPLTGSVGLALIQALPGSLRDPVAQASVSDHFQLGLHFAPHAPRYPRGWVVEWGVVHTAEMTKVEREKSG